MKGLNSFMSDGLLHGSEITLVDCCNLKRSEKLLIICDQPNMEIGSAFYKTAENRCQQVILIVLTPGNRHGSPEFPESVLKMLHEFDVRCYTQCQ